MYPWTNYVPPTHRSQPTTLYKDTPKQALLKSILQTPVYINQSDEPKTTESPRSSGVIIHPRKKLMAEAIESRVPPYFPPYGVEYREQHQGTQHPHGLYPSHPSWSHHPTRLEEEVYNTHPRQPSHVSKPRLADGGKDFTLTQINPGLSTAQVSSSGQAPGCTTDSVRHSHTVARTQSAHSPIPGSTLDALMVFTQRPVEAKPVEPRTDDKLLVSSILNPEPASQGANKKKSKKRKRKKKKSYSGNVNDQRPIVDRVQLSTPSTGSRRRVPMNMMSTSFGNPDQIVPMSMSSTSSKNPGQRVPMNMMSTSSENPGQRVPMNLILTSSPGQRIPMMSHLGSFSSQYPNLPDDIDGDEISDMSVSGDEHEDETEILQPLNKSPVPVSSSSKLPSNSARSTSDPLKMPGSSAKKPPSATYTKKFVVNLISAANADKFYPPKTGEIYRTGSSLFKCVERPFFGTVFDKVLQYVPLPDYSKVEVAEEDRTRINTGHRYTVWLDKSDSDYICLRKLERSAESSKSRSSYRGFSSGHGILRLHVREAFIPEHCPLANPSTMNYLHRALPNCPPPDMEMSVESDEPSNILIAAMIHRTPTNIEQRVTYSMLLFPHFIDCNYGEPSFPETLHVPKLRELFNIVQFDFRGDLDIFKFCKADNGFEVVHLSPSNHKNIEVISLL